MTTSGWRTPWPNLCGVSSHDQYGLGRMALFASSLYHEGVTSAIVVAGMPEAVVELLNKALVGELTVIDRKGHLRTDPLIPFWDGRYMLIAALILFSRTLAHVKRHR